MPTKMVSLRIDEALLEYLTERAKSEHRTLSNLIVSILIKEKENPGNAESCDLVDRQAMIDAMCNHCRVDKCTKPCYDVETLRSLPSK